LLKKNNKQTKARELTLLFLMPRIEKEMQCSYNLLKSKRMAAHSQERG
jgi:hypothetical protein